MKYLLIMFLLLLFACNRLPHFDIVIHNGTIYDGSGQLPFSGDIGITGDRIVQVSANENLRGKVEIDATGLAVSPGFINILSWADESLIEDGRSMSDIKQGITLEVFGEGVSMGPLNAAMKKERTERQGLIKYDIEWTTLGEFLDDLENRGISCNIASFVGATTLRVHEIGYENRPPTPEELARMKNLVRVAMQEGALGVGSSLIYTPAFYAATEEIIELCKVASEFGGMYISHLRSESNQLLKALDELIRIASEANLPAEVYHLKAAGKQNYGKLDQVIEKIDEARKQGLRISTDMYCYTAGATGLDATTPPWVQEGGYAVWANRLKNPKIRQKVAAEMRANTDEWENFFYLTGPEGILLSEFKNPDLRKYIGKTLAEVAKLQGKSPEETAMDLVIEDGSRVEAIYKLMSEENVRKKIRLPYMSFGSDGASMAAEGVFLQKKPHPRGYGNFARLLGKYVREEKLIPLEAAIHKLTALTANKLSIRNRGSLAPGYFADIVIFNPEIIRDNATFENPHQYASGVAHVIVNGVQVIQYGEHTGAKPGRVVRGPGWLGWERKK